MTTDTDALTEPTEDRPALRLAAIRRETERAIRNGTKLDPRLIRDMSMGRRA